VSAPRFFVSGIFDPGERVRLEAQDARKLTLVLRKDEGAALEVADSSGRVFAASLQLDAGRAFARLGAVLAAPAPLRLRLTLAQGLPKGQKMEYVVEKATELGLERILAFTSSRTIGDGARAGKLERWRRVAKSAAQQCGRPDIPEVDGPLAFAALLERVPAFDVALAPWELAPRVALRERLPGLIAQARSALVVIGPEGGFSEAEARELEGAGAHLVSLGSRILRTETAGLVACAAVFYAAGDI
jgi:16S rRNA (uracil1498-N3)-methyltransferase